MLTVPWRDFSNIWNNCLPQYLCAPVDAVLAVYMAICIKMSLFRKSNSPDECFILLNLSKEPPAHLNPLPCIVNCYSLVNLNYTGLQVKHFFFQNSREIPSSALRWWIDFLEVSMTELWTDWIFSGVRWVSGRPLCVSLVADFLFLFSTDPYRVKADAHINICFSWYGTLIL